MYIIFSQKLQCLMQWLVGWQGNGYDRGYVKGLRRFAEEAENPMNTPVAVVGLRFEISTRDVSSEK
jgi:hypothetical protein